MTPGFLELAASLAVVIAASPPPADPTKPPPCGYSVEFYVAPDCGIFPTSVLAVRINENGVAIGEREGCPTTSHERAFIWWPDGSVELIPLPPWTSYLGAVDISDEGVALMIASSVNPEDGSVALLYDGKQYIELEFPDWANRTEGGGIASGNIVGGSYGDSVLGPYPKPAFWDAEGFHDLSGLFEGGLRASVDDINSGGVVAGTTAPPPDPLNDQKRAWVYDGATLTILPPAPGAMNSITQAVSDGGHVVGYGHSVGGAAGPWKTFIWCDGQMQALPPLPIFEHDDTLVFDVNSLGVAVGRSERDESPSNVRYVIWFSEIPYELDPLVELPADAHISTPIGINDAGQIVGKGLHQGKYAAYRLTPNPPLFGDLTLDCAVGADDLASLLLSWGTAANTKDLGSDLNADGIVDGADLGLLLTAWSE